jgi:hypothetical protein
MVEISSGIITGQAIRRGTFYNVKDLETAIGASIEGWNDRARPLRGPGVDGQAFGVVQEHDRADLEGLRAQAASGRRVQTVHGPAVRGEKSTTSSASTWIPPRARLCCVWMRTARLSAGPHQPGVADDARDARAAHSRLCPSRRDQRVRRVQRCRRGRDLLVKVLERMPVEPCDLATAEVHGRLLAHVHRSGAKRPAHDLMIAATAVATKRIVLTRDRRAARTSMTCPASKALW